MYQEMSAFVFWIFENTDPQTHSYSLKHTSVLLLCIPFKYLLADFSQTTHHHTHHEAWLFLSATLSHISSQRAPRGLLLRFNIQSPTCKLFRVHTAHCWSHTILISLCIRRESDAMWLVWLGRVYVLCVAQCIQRSSEFLCTTFNLLH